MWRVALNRWAWMLLAALAFAVVAALVERWEYDIRSVILDWGKSAKCEYFQSGGILVGADGPFMGGPHQVFFNFLWRNAPWVVTYMAGFVAAAVVYIVSGRRASPRDGFTRCGVCGHILRGLTEPRCPECGVRI